MKTRLLQKHAKDCMSLKYVTSGSWHSVWWYEGVVTNGTGSGRITKSGKVALLILRCNSLACPAKMSVRFDDILKQVPKT